MSIFRSRPAFTLIEMMIFIAVFALVMAVALPLLFASTETRLRQQTIALVEDNAAQLIQNLTRRARNSERIIRPAMGTTTSVLALQHASGSINPIIFGVQTGSLVVIEKDTKWEVTSSQVAVLDFLIRNTSTSTDRQSLSYSFRISRTIRLQQPHTYERSFQGTITLHPDDTPQGDVCSCPGPVCSNDVYTWYICDEGLCYQRSDMMDCS